MYHQTSPPGHQQQQPAPPPYFEYQRNNGLRTPSSFGLPPTPQSANQQRCPIHGLQPCACQMVSFSGFFDAVADLSRASTSAKEDIRCFYDAHVRAWQCCKINKDREMYVLRTHVQRPECHRATDDGGFRAARGDDGFRRIDFHDCVTTRDNRMMGTLECFQSHLRDIYVVVAVDGLEGYAPFWIF